jgi:transposase, IS5 family
LIDTTNTRAQGGQFALHAKALPGNPYDVQTLRFAIEDTKRLTGREIERAYFDKGYRGNEAPNPHRVFISWQTRGVFGGPDGPQLPHPRLSRRSCWGA